jgi:hypothetical protein
VRLDALVDAEWPAQRVYSVPVGAARGEPVATLDHCSSTLTAAVVAQAAVAVERWELA